jgi:hypothetical protein
MRKLRRSTRYSTKPVAKTKLTPSSVSSAAECGDVPMMFSSISVEKTHQMLDTTT